MPAQSAPQGLFLNVSRTRHLGRARKLRHPRKVQQHERIRDALPYRDDRAFQLHVFWDYEFNLDGYPAFREHFRTLALIVD